jgi:hypothetical protein
MLRLIAAVLLVLSFSAPALASEEKSAAKVERYIKLNPFMAPISRDNRITGRLNVELTLELLKPENMVAVQEQLPRLNATFLSVVQRHAAALETTQALLNVDQMMSDIDNSTRGILPTGSVVVLIQQAVFTR